VSSRTARATQRNPVLKNHKKKKDAGKLIAKAEEYLKNYKNQLSSTSYLKKKNKMY
jgi:hypothetical protein